MNTYQIITTEYQVIVIKASSLKQAIDDVIDIGYKIKAIAQI